MLFERYTGKERDAETGLDDFGARYFNSLTGRFQSPDWANSAEPVPYARLDNPQTLNLYAYVANNPESMPDLNGHIHSVLEEEAIASRLGGGVNVGQAQMASTVDAADNYFDQVLQNQEEAQNTPPANSPAPSSAAPTTQSGAPAQQQTPATPGTPSRLLAPTAEIDPNSPAGQRDLSYQIADKSGTPIQQPGLSIIENAKVTKITPGYSADVTTSNGKPRSASDTGVVKDAVGPHDVDRTANYRYTTRQTFAVKQGDNVYPLTTTVRNQIVVVNGVISSVKTTIITP